MIVSKDEEFDKIKIIEISCVIVPKLSLYRQQSEKTTHMCFLSMIAVYSQIVNKHTTATNKSHQKNSSHTPYYLLSVF